MSETIRRKTDETTIFTIGFKLVMIVVIILSISLVSLTAFVFHSMRQDTGIQAENIILDGNRKASVQADDILSKTLSDSLLLVTMFNSAEISASLSQEIARNFYEQNRHIAYLFFTINHADRHIVNEEFFRLNEIDVSLASSYIKSQKAFLRQSSGGQTAVLNAAPHFSAPLLAIFFSGETGAAVTLFSCEKLTDAFSSEESCSWMVNASGDILIHRDFELARKNVNIADSGLFRGIQNSGGIYTEENTGLDSPQSEEISSYANFLYRIWKNIKTAFLSFSGKVKNMFFTVTGNINQNIIKAKIMPSGIKAINAVCKWFFSQFSMEWEPPWHAGSKNILLDETEITGNYSFPAADQFTAYTNLNTGGCVVITNIEYDTVYKQINTVMRRSVLLCFALLLFSALIVWIYSKSVTIPLKALASAARAAEGGEFNVILRPAGRDEIGILTTSLQKMFSALGVFRQFGNRDTALQSMRSPANNSGLQKHATILFSDIMGFAEISENFANQFAHDAPVRVFKWLNSCLARMIYCVEKTNGSIDKLIGDAVVAHWGISYTPGNPSREAYNCVKAALMMRKAVYEINRKRNKNDACDPHLCVSCGINSGMVTAGRLGAGAHIENTIIGDSVNLASRVESLNRRFGTDILISENTWSLVKKRFITEEMPRISIKGKENPVRIFAVINFAGIGRGPKTMSDVRRLLGIKTPEKQG
ncbi:MAG: adenylate/guanylate cyclase domain-containing protein [Treponema sp.]|jgi:adenylate cyclase|nr:adenylate/guanylate cyclase domain-containing protein [Treponema sp.]